MVVLPAAPTPAPITIPADPVRRAMDAAAASGLRKVSLTLGQVTFKLSGSRFRNGRAGMILCYENGSYAGYIDRTDVFHTAQHRTVTESMLTAFRAAAADPQAAARTARTGYGLLFLLPSSADRSAERHDGHQSGLCAAFRLALIDKPAKIINHDWPTIKPAIREQVNERLIWFLSTGP